MDKLDKNKPSNYEELTLLYSNKKSRIFLSKSNVNNKIYVKKVLNIFNKDVYEKLKELNSINLPKIYEIFEKNDKLIVIEEFINGVTIEDILNEGKKIDKEIALKYMIDLCEALEKLHSLKPSIIHRDIKPSNIIINNDGILKLIDYDVSREYKENKNKDTVILGTIGYAAPEQMGFEQTDARADIYSMGVLLNVMVTGKHPVEESVQGNLKEIVSKCTMLMVNERYQSVQDLKKVFKEELSKCKKSNESLKKKTEDNLKHNSNMLNLNKDYIDLNSKRENKNINFEKKYFLNLDKHNDTKIELKELNKRKSGFLNTFRQVIPGFRSNKLWKMILAISGYAFIIFGMTMDLKSKDINLIISDWVLGIMLLLFIALYFNFLNIVNRLPLLKSKEKKKKIGGYILYSVLIFLILGGILNKYTPPIT